MLELELCDDASIVKCAKEIKSRTGGVLDVLVNNVNSVVTLYMGL